MAVDAVRLVELFNGLFEHQQRTRLVAGGTEPIYRPRSANRPCAEVVFTRDFFASALHEVAHWCIAGDHRRQFEDYGYWYIADRDTDQQREFERAEVKPQALEKIFSECAAYPFKPSLDCLQNPEYRAPEFVKQIDEQYSEYMRFGLPTRARLFADALTQEFGGSLLQTSAGRVANG